MDKLAVPFCLISAGSTQSGKSTFIKKLILERDQVFKQPFENVYYFYTEWQPAFTELEVRGVQFEQGAPTVETFSEIPRNSLVILDDLMTSLCKSTELVDLVTIKSHHKSISVVFTTQQFYWDSNEMRCVTRNAHYISLHKSPRMASVADQLGRQIWPQRKHYLLDAYNKATQQPYGYLFLDLYPSTPENLRVKTKILPSEGYTHVFI
jgi:hypothetical protein